MLNEEFGEKFLTTVNKTDDNPVHLLFNQWWNEAPDDVKQKYLDIFLGDPIYKDGSRPASTPTLSTSTRSARSPRARWGAPITTGSSTTV